MRVAIHKGRIIEAQSGDGASFDAMKMNAEAAGFKLDEVEFSVIPDAEVFRRIEEQDAGIPKPKSPLDLRLDAIEERLTAVERR